jgi:hypothetical protein
MMIIIFFISHLYLIKFYLIIIKFSDFFNHFYLAFYNIIYTWLILLENLCILIQVQGNSHFYIVILSLC